MQHKATNFESIYFLEEISFLKVTSLKAVIVLIFLFFVSEFYEIFNRVSAKNLLIFFIAYLKKKKSHLLSHIPISKELPEHCVSVGSAFS